MTGPALIIGGGGMLGRAWRQLLHGRGIAFVAPTHAQFDLTHASKMSDQVDRRYPLVVNCAAWTDVDGAEKNELVACAVNGAAVGELARLCQKSGATLVNYSTDYVFDGSAAEPYAIDHPRDPLNAYGRSKAIGEEALERSGCRYLNIRTSWLYAPWGKNFVRTIANAARQKPMLKVVNDQRGRPTSCEHLAAASLGLLERNALGTFHVTDGGQCTWHDFAREIVRLSGAPCQVEPCTTAEFPRPAKRPAYSVLDLSRTESLLGPMPDWKQNLASVMARLEPLAA